MHIKETAFLKCKFSYKLPGVATLISLSRYVLIPLNASCYKMFAQSNTLVLVANINSSWQKTSTQSSLHKNSLNLQRELRVTRRAICLGCSTDILQSYDTAFQVLNEIYEKPVSPFQTWLFHGSIRPVSRYTSNCKVKESQGTFSFYNRCTMRTPYHMQSVSFCCFSMTLNKLYTQTSHT